MAFAARLISKSQLSNQNPSRPAHTDFLFLNGAPAAEAGTLWLNTYYEGRTQGDFKLTAANYSRAAKGAPLDKGFNTYTIDWQPSHVAW